MTLRVVLHAEGPAELGVFGSSPAPGQALHDDELGAAHVLVRRTLDHVDVRRFGVVRFDEPQRLANGRKPRGSELTSRKALRRLLTWPSAERRPKLAIVLVDQDGDTARFGAMRSYVQDVVPPVIVIAVAVEEFESWLLSDHVAAEASEQPPLPESMKPGQAKEHLRQCTQDRVKRDGVPATHRAIAESLRLEVLLEASRSFHSFRDDLAQAVTLIP